MKIGLNNWRELISLKYLDKRRNKEKEIWRKTSKEIKNMQKAEATVRDRGDVWWCQRQALSTKDTMMTHTEREREEDKYGNNCNKNSLKLLKLVLYGLDAWFGTFIKSFSKVISVKNPPLSQKQQYLILVYSLICLDVLFLFLEITRFYENTLYFNTYFLVFI